MELYSWGRTVSSNDAGLPPVGSAGVADIGDADLVLRTRAGDTAAFGELWRRHYLSGVTVARSVTSSLDADDLVQESYTRIYHSIVSGGGPTGSFRAYLFTSIRNTAATWGRARRETAIDALNTVEDPTTSEQATDDALDHSLTHRAFRSLPTRWQEVLWYSEIEQMKPAEIAPLLGLKPTAVAQLTFRAREGLREAWIQAHLRSLADGSDCQWTIEHLGAYARANLGRRDRVKVDSHLASCARCGIVASEAKEVSGRLALVPLPSRSEAVGTAGYSRIHPRRRRPDHGARRNAVVRAARRRHRVPRHSRLRHPRDECGSGIGRRRLGNGRRNGNGRSRSGRRGRGRLGDGGRRICGRRSCRGRRRSRILSGRRRIRRCDGSRLGRCDGSRVGRCGGSRGRRGSGRSRGNRRGRRGRGDLLGPECHGRPRGGGFVVVGTVVAGSVLLPGLSEPVDVVADKDTSIVQDSGSGQVGGARDRSGLGVGSRIGRLLAVRLDHGRRTSDPGRRGSAGDARRCRGRSAGRRSAGRRSGRRGRQGAEA